MKNIQQVGHLIEQPTRISNLRPQIAVFHGYSFVRSNNTTIECWLPGSCAHCKQDIRITSFFVRSQSLTDEDLQRHGLRLFAGKKPVRGLKIHTGFEGFHCEECKEKWLEGQALESVQ